MEGTCRILATPHAFMCSTKKVSARISCENVNLTFGLSCTHNDSGTVSSNRSRSLRQVTVADAKFDMEDGVLRRRYRASVSPASWKEQPAA